MHPDNPSPKGTARECEFYKIYPRYDDEITPTEVVGTKILRVWPYWRHPTIKGSGRVDTTRLKLYFSTIERIAITQNILHS